jgi:hypothetical protein
VLLLSLAMSLTCAATAQRLSEHEVKAAFLVNFAKFTDWPAEAFPGLAAPIVIGVAGDEVLRYRVDTFAKGKSFSGRTVRTLKVGDTNDAADVNLIFIGAIVGQRAPDILRAVRGLPILKSATPIDSARAAA